MVCLITVIDNHDDDDDVSKYISHSANEYNLFQNLTTMMIMTSTMLMELIVTMTCWSSGTETFIARAHGWAGQDSVAMKVMCHFLPPSHPQKILLRFGQLRCQHSQK